MPGDRISQLVELAGANVVTTDWIPIVDSSAGTTRKLDPAEIADIPSVASAFLATTQPHNVQTGTTYTLVLGDANDMVTLNNAGAITLTVPPNSSVAFPVGTQIDLAQLGAGAVTVTQGSGVTVNVHADDTRVMDGQYAVATLVKYATNTWLLFGKLVAA
jgi:hypothetical protein